MTASGPERPPARLPVGMGLSESVPILELPAWATELEELGFSSLWTGEVDGRDGLVPLALAGAATDRVDLGVSVLAIGTRGPALLAMSIATMAQLVPGRLICGLGSSSSTIVTGWNARPFERPLSHARDTLRFLREALGGAKVATSYDSFAVDGFRLTALPPVPPRLYLAALRPKMLELAAREADGVILNWLAPTDVDRIRHVVGPGTPLAARIYVAPTIDDDAFRAAARRQLAQYFTVPGYAAYQGWLGRGPQLSELWDRWRAGERRAAAESIPDEVVDDMFVHGSAQACVEGIRRYTDAGIDIPIVTITGCDGSVREAVRSLAASTCLHSKKLVER